MTPNGCLDSSVGSAIQQTVLYDQNAMEEMDVVDEGVDICFVFRMAQQGSMSSTATLLRSQLEPREQHTVSRGQDSVLYKGTKM